MRVTTCICLILGINSLGLAQEFPCDYSFSGRVYDRETNLPLPFVTVLLEKTEIGAVTDQEGNFTLDNLCSQEFSVQFSFVGYKTLIHHHDSYHEFPEIFLSPDKLILESVLVEGKSPESNGTQSKTVLGSHEIERLQSGNFSDLVGNVAGVGMISTGQNISKPVINGLYGNRILIITNGVRHEFQNWGVEHAPELDPDQIDQVEVVKGAGAIKYGPDALGGVLLVTPAAMELNSDFNLRYRLGGQSNGRAPMSNLHIGRGYDHWAFSLQGNIIRQGDLKTPDYFLTNTGKQEYSYAAGIRFHQNRFDLESRYSRFNQKLGILRGSVNGNLDDLVNAIAQEPPPNTRPFSYRIHQPFQWVDHQLVILKGTYRLDHQMFVLKAAYQSNHRQEYDVRRGSTQLTPNIDLMLNTQSIDFNWIHPDFNRFHGEIGIQWQYQDNNNLPGTRTAQFIPNFNYNRLGAFISESVDLNGLQLEGGLRYDYHGMDIRGVFQGSQFSNVLTYQNLSFMVGLLKKVSPNTQLRFNIGSSWRPPNMAEFYAFGRHQSVYEYGLWTYELDSSNYPQTATSVLSEQDRKVRSERGFKVTFSQEVTQSKIQLVITEHANFIQDYLYSKPAGITNTVRGAFPFFIYDQTNALLAGVDLNINIMHTADYTSKVSASYLWAKDISNHDYFVGLPPADAHYTLLKDLEVKGFQTFQLELGLGYYFKQFQAPKVISAQEILEAQKQGSNLFETNDSNFDLLAPPNGYALASVGVFMKKNGWSLRVKMNNALNQSYRNYTNRLRYYADEIGRNLSIVLGWSI